MSCSSNNRVEEREIARERLEWRISGSGRVVAIRRHPWQVRGRRLSAEFESEPEWPVNRALLGALSDI
jgi:hypothetical protein